VATDWKTGNLGGRELSSLSFSFLYGHGVAAQSCGKATKQKCSMRKRVEIWNPEEQRMGAKDDVREREREMESEM
jgi:hypothetical protein